MLTKQIEVTDTTETHIKLKKNDIITVTADTYTTNSSGALGELKVLSNMGTMLIATPSYIDGIPTHLCDVIVFFVEDDVIFTTHSCTTIDTEIFINRNNEEHPITFKDGNLGYVKRKISTSTKNVPIESDDELFDTTTHEEFVVISVNKNQMVLSDENKEFSIVSLKNASEKFVVL